MSLIQQYIQVIGAFQGVMLFVLLSFDSRSTAASRWLGVWCLLLALNFLGPFLYQTPELNPLSWLIGWSIFLPSCYGALLFLYCRSAVMEQTFSVRDLLLFTPAAACYLLNADILLAPAEEKLVLILNNGPYSDRLMVSQLIMFAQAFIFAAFTALLIKRYQLNARNTLANFNPAKFEWLWRLMALNLTIWLLKTVWGVTHWAPVLSDVADLLIIVLIVSIAMAHWRDSSLFRIDQLSDDAPSEGDPGPSTAGDSGGALDEATRAELIKVVKQQMQARELYRDSTLTLSSLAEATQLSTHHLSEVLNKHEGKNFYQFVNEYRIAEVRRRFQAETDDKILDIAIDAGFASKSAFNSIFKRFTGLTPSQYRRHLEKRPD